MFTRLRWWLLKKFQPYKFCEGNPAGHKFFLSDHHGNRHGISTSYKCSACDVSIHTFDCASVYSKTWVKGDVVLHKYTVNYSD